MVRAPTRTMSVNLFGLTGCSILGEIKLFGSMVVAGPTPDVIYILVPDSTTCNGR